MEPQVLIVWTTVIDYHLYHLGLSLPPEATKKCVNLFYLANEFTNTFYAAVDSLSGTFALDSDPFTEPKVRVLSGGLKSKKAAGVHSGGLLLFQLRRPNCNQIKALAKFDRQLAFAPSWVR